MREKGIHDAQRKSSDGPPSPFVEYDFDCSAIRSVLNNASAVRRSGMSTTGWWREQWEGSAAAATCITRARTEQI